MTKLRSSVFGWKSVWMDLAEETNGEFADGPTGVTCRVPLKETPWTLTIKMNEHSLPPAPKRQTIIAAPYRAQGNFSFALHNKTWYEEAAKPFGLQDIEIGVPDFDAEYIIQGSDPELVRQLLGSSTLRQMIQDQKHVRLAVYKDSAHLSQFGSVPAGIHVLEFREDAEINSFERLAGLGELLSATLEQLCRIGVAAKANPGFVI